jgi:hypothetical protein
MARKRYNDEDFLRLLRGIEVHLNGANLGGKVTILICYYQVLPQ